MKEIINAQEERVRLIVRKFFTLIEDVSRTLLEKERINGHYLRELLRREQKKAG
jgi:ATP-dependent Zn protease